MPVIISNFFKIVDTGLFSTVLTLAPEQLLRRGPADVGQLQGGAGGQDRAEFDCSEENPGERGNLRSSVQCWQEN